MGEAQHKNVVGMGNFMYSDTELVFVRGNPI